MKISATIFFFLSTALLVHALPLIDSNDARKNSPSGTIINTQKRSLNTPDLENSDGSVTNTHKRSLNTPDLESTNGTVVNTHKRSQDAPDLESTDGSVVNTQKRSLNTSDVASNDPLLPPFNTPRWQ
ncbi:MAG: hypothetical protein JOS17DRAFT_732273 [Linnemannia elongata]|nr:MAG: hypothetical protein JOS17DRAFT_732273 [Linnemannia elongata]